MLIPSSLIISLTSLSATGVSTVITTANEIIKERILEPHRKKLEREILPLYYLNSRSNTVDTFVTAGSSDTLDSYVTAQGN